MVWEGDEAGGRGLLNPEEPRPSGHLPTASALSSGWSPASREAGRERTNTGEGGQSSFYPRVERQGALRGELLGSNGSWEDGGQADFQGDFHSLGKAIGNSQTSVRREPAFPTK